MEFALIPAGSFSVTDRDCKFSWQEYAMDDCYDVHIEHQGTIEIIENGILKEKINASEIIAYEDGVIEIDGK